MRTILALVLAAAPAGGLAVELQPGEWEFSSTTTSPLLPGPQKVTFTHCIRKEDADNPDRWMGQPSQEGDCKVTPGAKSGDTYAWKMECPKANLRGNGTARLSAGAMEGETHLTGEVQGKKFELLTKVTGRRLGPCKG